MELEDLTEGIGRALNCWVLVTVLLLGVVDDVSIFALHETGVRRVEVVRCWGATALLGGNELLLGSGRARKVLFDDVCGARDRRVVRSEDVFGVGDDTGRIEDE